MKGYYKEILESGEYRGFKITKDINFPLGERFFAEHPNEEFVKTDSCLEGLIDDINEWHEDQLEEEIKLLKAENEQLKKRVAELDGDADKIELYTSEGIEHTIFKDKNYVSLDVSMYQQNTFLEIEEVITYGYSSNRICLGMKTDDFVDQLKTLIAGHNKKFNISHKG